MRSKHWGFLASRVPSGVDLARTLLFSGLNQVGHISNPQASLQARLPVSAS